jgi:hypothetical protein
MSKKKKKQKHFGNPAAAASRPQGSQNQTADVSTSDNEAVHAAPASGFTSATDVHADQATATDVPQVSEDGVLRVTEQQLLVMFNELRATATKLQEDNINLQTDFQRVLKSYAALITNTFKLNITMEEFDVNEPRTIERLQSKFSFFIEDLPRNAEKAGIRMPNLVGLDYTPGLNVEALNADEFEPGTALEIDEVVEPLLIFDPKNSGAESGSVRAALKNGLVTVKKKGE